MLNPEGWNSYECLAEAYLKAGNKELVELNPKNDNAIKILGQIK